MNSKREKVLDKLIGAKPAKTLSAVLTELQATLDKAGVVSKARKELMTEVEEETETKATPDVEEIAAMIMALVTSNETEDVKREQLQTLLSDVMALSAESKVADEDNPDGDDGDDEEDAQKAQRVKALDMLTTLVDDMGDLAKDMDMTQHGVKALADTVSESVASLVTRIDALEKRMKMASRASTSDHTIVSDELAKNIKEQGKVFDSFFGISRDPSKVPTTARNGK
jgi:hypothetical protein